MDMRRTQLNGGVPIVRIEDHPILGPLEGKKEIKIEFNGEAIDAFQGEPIAAALLAAGIRVCRETSKHKEPRGVFCAIGQCTDCMMIVDGVLNVRTCITPARSGMKIYAQKGLGGWGKDNG